MGVMQNGTNGLCEVVDLTTATSTNSPAKTGRERATSTSYIVSAALMSCTECSLTCDYEGNIIKDFKKSKDIFDALKG